MKTNHSSWLYTPDGARTEISPAVKKFTLEEVQAFVGGYLEHIAAPEWPYHICLADEDGLQKGLPENQRASEAVGRRLVGNVVLLDHRLFD